MFEGLVSLSSPASSDAVAESLGALWESVIAEPPSVRLVDT